MAFSRPVHSFEAQFLLPKFWGMWLLIGLFYLLALLPWALQVLLGCGIGRLFMLLAKRRKYDTLVNLQLCYPELNHHQHAVMVKQIFENMGVGVFETLNAWLMPRWFRYRIEVSGLEHISKAQAAGRGVLGMVGHYTILDVGAFVLSKYIQADMVYRPQDNKLLDWFIFRARRRVYQEQIDYGNMRAMVSSLRQGHMVWYTPDQDFGLKNGVMAPFFGIPAATITAQRRVVQMAKCDALCIHYFRVPARWFWQKPIYRITLLPPFEQYPSESEEADAALVNATLAELINKAPTQYMWFHRRFKTRPPGMTHVYQKIDKLEKRYQSIAANTQRHLAKRQQKDKIDTQ